MSFWGLPLSRPLRIFGLVGHYPANYLIRRRLVVWRCLLGIPHPSRGPISAVILSFPRLWRTTRKIIDVLLSLLPLLRANLHALIESR